VYQQQRCVTVQRFVTAQQPRRVFGRVLPLQRHLVIPVDDEKQRMGAGTISAPASASLVPVGPG
jgi:hypothetical protein